MQLQAIFTIKLVNSFNSITARNIKTQKRPYCQTLLRHLLLMFRMTNAAGCVGDGVFTATGVAIDTTSVTNLDNQTNTVDTFKIVSRSHLVFV